jgi:AraC-like DNA-binding protein/quercetin dioxygenase-like cupin family protein
MGCSKKGDAVAATKDAWHSREENKPRFREAAKFLRCPVMSPHPASLPVTAQTLTHAAGVGVASHTHCRGQLGVVTRGTMTVISDAGWWLAPPGQGVWVPPDTPHGASYSESSSLIQLLIDPGLTMALPRQCRTIVVSALLRELAREVVRLAAADDANEAVELVARLIVHQMARPRGGPLLFVPHGRDRRLRRVIERLRDDPGLDATLDELAGPAGGSPRTLARLFVAETGMTFGRWREHLRIVAAVDRLTRGQSITRTALDLGYQSPSSFTTMFTRTLGLPPGLYLKALQEGRLGQ